ncbi:MAG: c-type cytochrome [Thiobacillus sp.]|nr:c-type cytochrome [Thiobacillus sp.]MDP2977773.1 c-type cytochrome [Thiobacillus sp.]MDZ7584972.1 c-type cytochrome [Thiobacillus sp.]
MMMKLMMTAAAAALLLSGAASASQALAQKNACLACHGVDKKIVGPAFKEIAKKYAGDKGAHDKLAAKVKAGGKGVWGEIPMPPNPAVKAEEVSKIVDWVLSLK